MKCSINDCDICSPERDFRALARRVRGEAGSLPHNQVQRAFLLTLSRHATPAEEQEALEALRGQDLEVLCRALLNSNEFLFIP
jgi:hypothetical protein